MRSRESSGLSATIRGATTGASPNALQPRMWSWWLWVRTTAVTRRPPRSTAARKRALSAEESPGSTTTASSPDATAIAL